MVKKVISALLISGLLLSGCATSNPYTGQRQTSDTAIGAGVGAVGGALLGTLFGGHRDSALIGAALGGVAGGAIGNTIDRQNAELHRVLEGSGVEVRKVGQKIDLVMSSDITFKLNSADIRTAFYNPLNSIAIVLKRYPRTYISIVGYTDNTGNAEYNQKLSERRAQSIGQYLMAQGIPQQRIITSGMGARQPIASNATQAGRAANRRVQMELSQI